MSSGSVLTRFFLLVALAVTPVATAVAQPLQSGDVVRVAIWREPTLSGDFPIDELGLRAVTTQPWADVREALLTEYRRQLRAESIALTPLRRIYVLGAVSKPGVYMMDPTFELRGIVSMAGGATMEGSLDHVRILRDGATVAKDLSLTQTALDFGVRSGDQIFVDRRSWVDRNSALLLSSFLSLAGVVGILVRR
jgi:protein involved in polysaccharide export with SLBB domain